MFSSSQSCAAVPILGFYRFTALPEMKGCILVGGFNPFEKCAPGMAEHKKWLKPPPSILIVEQAVSGYVPKSFPGIVPPTILNHHRFDPTHSDWNNNKKTIPKMGGDISAEQLQEKTSVNVNYHLVPKLLNLAKKSVSAATCITVESSMIHLFDALWELLGARTTSFQQKLHHFLGTLMFHCLTRHKNECSDCEIDG